MSDDDAQSAQIVIRYTRYTNRSLLCSCINQQFVASKDVCISECKSGICRLM